MTRGIVRNRTIRSSGGDDSAFIGSGIQARPLTANSNRRRGEETGEYEAIRPTEALEASFHEELARQTVAEMLDGEPVPALAVSRQLVVLHVNPTFAALSGIANRADGVELDAIVRGADLLSVQDALERVLRGLHGAVAMTIVGAHGATTQLAFRAQVVRVGECELVALRATGVKLLGLRDDHPAFAGRVYRVTSYDGALRMDGGDARRSAPCHEVVTGSSAPCPGCPTSAALAQGTAKTAVCPSTGGISNLRLVRAVPTGPTQARVECVELSNDDVSRMVAAQIDRAAVERGLSTRERSVLECLLLGRSLDDIALMLGISRHTAKFHQANILTKLGAESRADLIRILL